MTRRFLLELVVTGAGMLVAGVVAIPTLLTGLSPAIKPRRREIWRPIGPLADIPIGLVQEKAIPTDRNAWPRSLKRHALFVRRRSETDLVILSRSCTDLGCPLDYDPGSSCFFCPCHGGIFAQDGERLAGPPNRPMHRYAHRIRDDVLEIDISSIPPGA